MEASTNRLSRGARNALHVMNMAVLNRIYAEDTRAARRRLRYHLVRRLIVALGTDVSQRDGIFERSRGLWFGLRHMNLPFEKDVEALREWYPDFQHDLLQRYRRTR